MVTDKKARRRQRERDAAGSHSKAAASILLAMQRGCCAYCGDPATQRDHKIALAQGGTNDLQNIQWLCKPCNTAKWAHDDATERARRGIAERTQWDANPLQAEMLLVALLI